LEILAKTEPPIANFQRRIPSLDGARGILALVVMLAHFAALEGYRQGLPYATLSVYGFFFISGYALTVGWQGFYVPFLVKRFVRLWPMYAVALAIGSMLTGVDTPWHDFFWAPFRNRHTAFPQDPPVWSLYTEVYAGIAMPLIILSARNGWTAVVATLACLLMSGLQGDFVLAPFFIAGAFAATRIRFDVAILNGAIAQWLGKISYSLYLTHALTIVACKHASPVWWSLVSIPLAFLVAAAFQVLIEGPSIRFSRAAAKALIRVERVSRATLAQADLLKRPSNA